MTLSYFFSLLFFSFLFGPMIVLLVFIVEVQSFNGPILNEVTFHTFWWFFIIEPMQIMLILNFVWEHFVLLWSLLCSVLLCFIWWKGCDGEIVANGCVQKILYEVLTQLIVMLWMRRIYKWSIDSDDCSSMFVCIFLYMVQLIFRIGKQKKYVKDRPRKGLMATSSYR